MSSSANKGFITGKPQFGAASGPPAKEEAPKMSGDRRRSSGSGGTKFSGLMNQKRNSQDVSAARKASFAEQGAPPGVLGNFWNSLTKPNQK